MPKSAPPSLSSSSEFDKKTPNITKIVLAIAFVFCVACFTPLFWYSQVPAIGVQALAKLGIIFVFPTTMQIAKGTFALLGAICVTTAITALYHGIRFSLDLLSNLVDYIKDKYDDYSHSNQSELTVKLSASLDKITQSAKDHLPTVPVTWSWPSFISTSSSSSTSKPGGEPTPPCEPTEAPSNGPSFIS